MEHSASPFDARMTQKDLVMIVTGMEGDNAACHGRAVRTRCFCYDLIELVECIKYDRCQAQR